jgi:hypothetical protein
MAGTALEKAFEQKLFDQTLPAVPPANAKEGDTWWHPQDGVMLVRYQDTWVQIGAVK